MKKLKDPEEPVARLFSRACELRGKLGPVLYQLPDQMPKNVERLAAFLDALPPRIKHAIEFRNPEWYNPDVMQLLPRHNVALCLHDMRWFPGAAAVDGAVYLHSVSRCRTPIRRRVPAGRRSRTGRNG